MTFESEEIRHAFHLLPTQIQYDWNAHEQRFSFEGRWIHVLDVRHREDGTLEILITVNQKLVAAAAGSINGKDSSGGH